MDTIQTFIQNLEAEQKACRKNATALIQDHRSDEADLIRIRSNIFGIVISLCHVAESQVPANPVVFIQNKIEDISQAWTTSRAAAEQYGDHVKAAVEDLKLKVLSEINTALMGMVEVNL